MLKDTQIKSFKPKSKPYSKADGAGLTLLIKSNGSKLWRYRYRYQTKQQIYSIGKYPIISLLEAREKATELRAILASGKNPMQIKKQAKQQVAKQLKKSLHTFKKLSLEVMNQRLSNNEISALHHKRVVDALRKDAYPKIGEKPINLITTNDIKSIILEKKDKPSSARKLYFAIQKIFKILITRDNANDEATNYQIINPPQQIELNELIGKKQVNHYPTITDDKGIANLLQSIDEYSGFISTKLALKMLSLTFVRPSNIRLMKWNEIDFKRSFWIIPPNKMKIRKELIVPLSNQMIKLLQEAKLYSGNSDYVLPSPKSKSVPLSDGALIGAIRRIGYSTSEFTPHGFRAMFSTIAHEKSKYSYEAIEIQLSHTVGSTVSQAYNRADYLEERINLMRWWSDYLESLI